MDRGSLVQGGGGEGPPVPTEVGRSERRRLNVMVLLILSAGSAILLGRMLWPFITAIITAVVIAVLAFPAHRRIDRLVRNQTLAALVSTSLLFVLVVIPIVALSLALFNSLQANGNALSDQIEAFLALGGRAQDWLDRARQWLGSPGGDVADAARSQIQELTGFLAGRTVGILSGLGGGMIQAGVALFTLFYLLLDGPDLLKQTERIIPLEDELTEALMKRSREIIQATMLGNVVVGIVQGILGGLAFWALDIPGAVLWGSVMGVLGLVPVVGPPLVWVPAAAILALQGDLVRAAILVGAGALILGTVDNLLRATVVGDRAQLHTLVVLFSALGGILLFGVTGIFLGPVLFVIAISILEVTRLALDPESLGRPVDESA